MESRESGHGIESIMSNDECLEAACWRVVSSRLKTIPLHVKTCENVWHTEQ